MKLEIKLFTAFLILLIYSCRDTKKGSEKVEDALENVAEEAEEGVVFPEYQVGDCVVHSSVEAEVSDVSDKPLVSTKQFLYKLRYDDGSVSDKFIVESQLDPCNAISQ